MMTLVSIVNSIFETSTPQDPSQRTITSKEGRLCLTPAKGTSSLPTKSSGTVPTAASLQQGEEAPDSAASPAPIGEENEDGTVQSVKRC